MKLRKQHTLNKNILYSTISKNNSKGVTMIALIVTIIVLLILAGITIATLSGEANIVSKATDTQIQTQLSELQEGLEKFKITIEEGTVKEGDFSSRISNKYLKEHKIIEEVETKEGIKLGIIQDFKTIKINTKFGQKGKEIDSNWNEKMEELYDVFAIDMSDNTIYYIKNEKVWSAGGTIEIADIENKIEIKKSPKMKMSPSEGLGLTNETTVTISAKAEEGKTLKEDNIYEYYISKSTNALIGGSWRTFENEKTFKLELKQKDISYYIFVKRVEDSQGIRSTGNDTIISGIPYHKFGPFRSSGVIENYRITYELDNGILENPITSYSSNTETFTLKQPIKTGYTFIGWTGSNGTTPEKEVKIEKGSSGSKTYRANYRANTYTIEYDGNGAEGKTEKSIHTYDIEKKLTENGFGNLGYTFKGWNLNKDAQTPVFSDMQKVRNITGEDGAVVKLYAIWKDETAPTIKVEPESSVVAKNTNVKITVEEIGGSGLSKDNRYEYQLGTSNTIAPTGSWDTYTSGTSNIIGTDLTGTYYLWVREIKDNSGNISTSGGTKVGTYHVYGTYVFDNSSPTITFTPNTNTTYAKLQTTKVDVEDIGTSGVNTSTLKYQWTQNAVAPTEASFTTTFTNNTNVSKNDGTGNNWYLWVLAKDNLGNTIIKSSGVFYLDNTNPTNTAPTGTVTSNTATVTFKQIDNDSGIKIKQYAIKKASESNWGEWVSDAEDVHTFTNLIKDTQYHIKTKVTDNAGNEKESEILTIKTEKLDEPIITATPTTWTNGDVTVTINYPDLSYVSKQYSYDGTNWTDTTVNPTTLTITENKTIYARIIDSTNQVSGTATLCITNIDKTTPSKTSYEVKNITTLGYDVYVYGVSDNESGIREVRFPTWTTYNWQDDLPTSWNSNPLTLGTNLGNGTWYFRVNITEHNNEYGEYLTDVYLYDNVGNFSTISTSAIVPAVRVTYDENYMQNNIWTNSYDINRYNPATTAAKNKEIIEDKNVQAGKITKLTMSSGTGGGEYYSPSARLENGKTYTWSVYLKTSTPKDIYIGDEQNGLKTISTSTEWQKFTHTFTANDNAWYAFVFYLTNGAIWNDGDEIYIHSLSMKEGIIDNTQTLEKQYNSSLGTLAVPIREGHIFNGWYTKSSEGTQITDETKVPNSDVTYYAHWTTNKYTITANGYKNRQPPVNWEQFQTRTYNEYYGTEFHINPNDFTTPTGYTYGNDPNWSTNGYVSTNGNNPFVVKADTEVHLHYYPISYTITYNGNGAAGGSTYTSTHSYDIPKNLTTNGFTRPGYTFLGWSTNSNANSATYLDGQSVTNLTSVSGGNVNLYAIWLGFNTNPSNATVNEGQTATFSVSGFNQTSYQWYYSSSPSGAGVIIDGANSSTYSVVTSREMNGRYYYCVVGNNGKTSESGRAQLTVNYPFEISTEPQDYMTSSGATATFNVGASGGNPSNYSYQWQANDNLQTNISYNIPNYGTDSFGNYITKTPAETWYQGIMLPYVNVKPGKTYTWSFEVYSPTAFNIQWDSNCLDNGGVYGGNDDAIAGTITGREGTVQANTWTKVWITCTPKSNTAIPNLCHVFCPQVSGSNNLTIYYRNGQLTEDNNWWNISGATGSSYSTSDLNTINKTAFRCNVSNGIYSKITNNVMFSDNILPVLDTTVSTTSPTNQDVTVTINTDTTNKYSISNYAPGSNNGGITEDVTTTEPGPISSAKTWKLTKTATNNQWNGFESMYSGEFTANTNDLIVLSGYYKTSAAAGVGNLSMGAIYKADWSAPYNVSVLDVRSKIIDNGQWQYFYCVMRANESFSNGIVVDGPSWGYSTQAGTLYMNGVNWRVIPSGNKTAQDIHVRKYAQGNQNVSYFKNGGGTLIQSNTFNVSTNGTYTVYVEDYAGNGTVKTVDIWNIDKTPPTITEVQAGGILYSDPTFASGNNSTNIYNNNGNGTVTLTREAMSTPTGSGYGLRIQTVGSASPGWGGFYFANGTGPGKVFYSRIIAKIPTGCYINWASNAYGGGSIEWITSQEGTGDWKEYIVRVNCGNDGNYSSTNFYYITGGNVPLTWYVAYATVIDTTGWGTTNNALFKATDSTGIVGYGINQSNSIPPAYTSCTNQTSLASQIEGIASNGTYYIWVKDIAGNQTVRALSVAYVDRSAPSTPGIIYNGGANTCAWKNNYNITLASSDTGSGVSYYEIDNNNDGVADTTTGSNFIPGNGWHSCTNRFRAVDYVGNRSGWTENQHVHMDTGLPGVPSITYNGGANSCSWKNNYNITLSAGDDVSGVAYYEIDWGNDGSADTTTGANFIPGSGWDSHTNRFRAVDNAGNRGGWTENQHIHMDTGAPNVPTVAYNSGANTCTWKNNYNISLSSVDGNSGIAYYEIDFDGNNTVDTTTGSNFIPWNGYSSCTTRFRAVDGAGNRSGWTENHHIHMDTEAPGKTYVNLNGYSSGSWINGNVTQSFSATDNVAISRFQCSHDGYSGWYDIPNPWLINWDGQWNFWIRAVDHAGNVGPSSDMYTIRRDATAPSTPGITYNGGANTCTWKNNYNITLSSSDNLVGVSYYEIDTNYDGIADTTTGSNFIPPNGWSTCTARFRAVDGVGNRSGWTENQHIHMDTGSPGVPTVTYNGGSNTCGWKNNYNITLSAWDDVSGISYYEIDTNNDGYSDQTTGANFIPSNGFTSCTTRFRAVDYVGHRSGWTDVHHIHMDTQAPAKTRVSLNGYSSGSWTNGNVTQTASCNDNVGIASYQYSHDKSGVGAFSNPWTINWEGQWNFYVRAVDHAGNVGEWSDGYTLRIDKTPPNCSVGHDPNSAFGKLWDLIVLFNDSGGSGYNRGEFEWQTGGSGGFQRWTGTDGGVRIGTNETVVVWYLKLYDNAGNVWESGRRADYH